MSKDPYSGDLRATRDKELRDIKSPAALAAISDDMSDEIVSVGKRVVTRSYEVVEEDLSPEYLLPSNGGYNPKTKSMFIEAEIEPKTEPRIVKPKKPIDYVAMMQRNIKQMRRIHGDGRQRETLQELSKNHYKE